MQLDYNLNQKETPETPEQQERKLIKQYFKNEADIAEECLKSSTFIEISEPMRKKTKILKALNEIMNPKKG